MEGNVSLNDTTEPSWDHPTNATISEDKSDD